MGGPEFGPRRERRERLCGESCAKIAPVATEDGEVVGRGGWRPLKNEFRRVCARRRGREDSREDVRQNRGGKKRQHRAKEQTREGSERLTWGG
jgi:hypothetical protein